MWSPLSQGHVFSSGGREVTGGVGLPVLASLCVNSTCSRRHSPGLGPSGGGFLPGSAPRRRGRRDGLRTRSEEGCAGSALTLLLLLTTVTALLSAEHVSQSSPVPTESLTFSNFTNSGRTIPTTVGPFRHPRKNHVPTQPPTPRRDPRTQPPRSPTHLRLPGPAGTRARRRPWEECGPGPGSPSRRHRCRGIDYKTTTILLDGRRVKLELWDTSGQGRFCTIFRSYSRGAQGILLVYDITNRWSFDGIDRWIKEIDEHAPGVPRILVGNRLHLAFKRQVPTEQARAYAEKNCMTFFEVSPLCNFNVIESFTELSRIVLMRHGMEKIWRPNRVFSLQDLCCRAIVSCTPVHLIDKLPLPVTIKSHLKSFSMANGMNAVMMHGRSYSLASGAGGGGSKGNSLKRSKSIRPPQSPPQNCSRSNCKIS
nr:ras-related protein Rab-40C isoform X1 [Pongo pygmaeus]